jgi:uncharacterized membrane protein
MSALRILAVVLIVGGVLGLVYHRFSYTKQTHEAKIGSLDLSLSSKENVDIPDWAAVGAVVAGAAILLFGASKR